MKVDIRRLVEYIPELFAPSIHDNQTFLAYLDADENSFTVQGDNLSTGGSGASSASVKRLEQSITTLQTTVDGIQSAMAEGAENPDASIVAVDDIVYGYYSTNGEIPTITPSNVIQLKGRPFLTDMTDYVDSFVLAVDNYLNSSQLNADVTLSPYLDNGNAYAAFRDRKIYTITNSRLSSVNLNNGDIIFNKADNALYVYDANNHKFIKASGKRHYVVDYLVDYIGQTLPNNLNSNEVVFFEINSSDFYYSTLHNHGRDTDLSNLNDSCCFANIQSTLNDDASIYALVGYQGIRVIHDIYDGDTVYNKADGCTYTFTVNGNNKSFVKTSSIISESSISVVDDIIWGVFDASDENSSLPANLKAMRGRQYLDVNDNNYSLPTFLVVNFFSSGQPLYDGAVYCAEISGTKVLAAFYDGKIYTVDESGIMSSKNLNDGDAFLNKADNSLYVFDAQNHKFIRTGGNHHYTVDMFIDYIGSTWPSNIPDGGMLILKPESYSSYVEWKGYYEYVDSRYYANFSLNNATSFANISSELTDDACIYSYIPEGGSEAFIRVIHELYDGDTIYNKADGYTYTFSANGNNKSFVRISEPTIPPVCDILHVVTRLSQVTPSAAGDKCIWYEPEDNNYSGYLYTADSNLEWRGGTQIENNEFYASLDNHKIYSFRGWDNMPFMPVTIPAGVPFFNKADNSLYVFDGTQFIKITSS